MPHIITQQSFGFSFAMHSERRQSLQHSLDLALMRFITAILENNTTQVHIEIARMDFTHALLQQLDNAVLEFHSPVCRISSQPDGPLCVICSQALFSDPDSEPWTAPCAHIFHRHCLERFAGVRQCAVLELHCPVCRISFQPVLNVESSSGRGQ